MKPKTPQALCGPFEVSTHQTVVQKVDRLVPKEVSARLMQILRAYRRKLMGMPGGASPNMREWSKLLKMFFAHAELTEHFLVRGLPEKEKYRWPIDKDYGRAFVLFDSGLDHRAAAAELGISDAHARVLRSNWRRAAQRAGRL